jgi:7-carboxy-7-deazaguanine synthase
VGWPYSQPTLCSVYGWGAIAATRRRPTRRGAGAGFVVALETNGTIAAPAKIDWLTVSPKARSDVVQRDGNELKLVYPQLGLAPEDVADWDFDRFYLQPMDGEHHEENTRAAIRYCLEHPQWALSLQTHKIVGLP